MKKLIIIIVAFYTLFIPSVYAHEMLSDGWHIIPTKDADKSQSWDKQSKVWALYVNGVEQKRYNTFIGVHRGWGDAPENSLAAFKSVKNHGYYGFETDVRFTKDNVAVLCHDTYINDLAVKKDLSAITGNKIYVKDLTYSQLKNNYIFNIQRLNTDSNKKLSNYNSNRITTFEQMLDYVKESNMQVSIELKEGNQSQIKSLVQMVNQKGLSNNVRWISYYVNLLEYVKNADGSQKIGVLIGSAGKCDGNSNRYCEGDGRTKADAIYNRVKTNNNMVWFGDTYTSRYNLPRTNFGNNMPKTKAETDQKLKNNTLSTIPQGKITLNNTSISMDSGNKKEINYTYNGDGTVKCKSENSTISCNVDSSKKKITISSNSNVTGKVNIYATQGYAYSATNDYPISVIVKEKEVEDNNIVSNITVKNYDLDFDKNTYNYKLNIKNENKLDIICSLKDNSYKYEIIGNNNLKNGSVIKINILKDNVKKYTYSIEIVKQEIKPVEETPQEEIIEPEVEEPQRDIEEQPQSEEPEDTTSIETTARVVFERNEVQEPEPVAATPINNNTEPTIVDVPNTEKNDSYLFCIIASIVLLIGFTYIEKNAKKYRINNYKGE